MREPVWTKGEEHPLLPVFVQQLGSTPTLDELLLSAAVSLAGVEEILGWIITLFDDRRVVVRGPREAARKQASNWARRAKRRATMLEREAEQLAMTNPDAAAALEARARSFRQEGRRADLLKEMYQSPPPPGNKYKREPSEKGPPTKSSTVFVELATESLKRHSTLQPVDQQRMIHRLAGEIWPETTAESLRERSRGARRRAGEQNDEG